MESRSDLYVDSEKRPSESVFRSSTIRGRAEPRIAPRSRPRGIGINFGVGKGFLIADERPIRRSRSVYRRFPTSFPKNVVAAEKCKMNARVASGLNVAALGARPVFVMADRKKYFVVCQ